MRAIREVCVRNAVGEMREERLPRGEGRLGDSDLHAGIDGGGDEHVTAGVAGAPCRNP